MPTGLVALISDLVPLAIAILSFPILGVGLSRRQWAGTAISIAGVLIVSGHSFSVGFAHFWAYLLRVVGMFFFAMVSVLQKRFGSVHLPIHQSLAIQCLSAALFFAIWASLDSGLVPPADIRFGIGILWLIFVATYVCFGVYYLTLRTFSAAKVSSVVHLSTPFTMIWSASAFAESLSAAMFLGLVVSLAGVWMASWRQ